MTPSPDDFVKQAIAVHFPAPVNRAAEDRVAAAVKANVDAGEFVPGYPTHHSLSHPESPADGGFVVGVANYFRASPLSAADLSQAMSPIGDGRHEGVALTISDRGISSVEFSGR